MYALIVSNQATELIMQSRKLKAEETIYILTLWESQREPDSMETYPGGEAARAACPPLCWWSKIWLDILPSSLPIRGASGQSSLRPVSHSTKDKVLVWHPALLSSISQTRGNSLNSPLTLTVRSPRSLFILPWSPHWSQSHSFVSGSGYQSSTMLAVPNPTPYLQHKQLSSTLTVGSFSRLAETKRETAGSSEAFSKLAIW